MDSVLGLIRHSGNDGLLRALEMSVVATFAGRPLHLHAEGLRGTGKTTVMRAVRQALPPIRRITGCLYNCEPANPHCPQHREMSTEELAVIGEEWIPMPFLEISHSAKIGTVVGSIDLGRLVSPTEPQAALLPGTIPQAHRGIIFVDEINRLAETAPELADVLLDVMGTKPGRVQIEETGLRAVELPVQVAIWAASNPDEDPGPLEEVRRQLSDRFDFAVYAERPTDPDVVSQILMTTSPDRIQSHTPIELDRFQRRLAHAVDRLRKVTVPDGVRRQIAELYAQYNIESLRAVQAIQMGAQVWACLGDRDEAAPGDLAAIVPMALRHRVDPETLRKVLGQLRTLSPEAEAEGAAMPTVAAQGRFTGISFSGMAVKRAPEAAPSERSPESPQPQIASGWVQRTWGRFRDRLRGSGAGQQTGSHASNQSVYRPDPLSQPQIAPPHPARPIAQLQPHEYIRTEEELGRWLGR
jgi:magnesium chelatase subunit I